MNQKQIDELLDLIDRYAAMQGVEPYDAQVDVRDEIEAKLRESSLKPLSAQQIRDAWYECGIGIAYDIPPDQDNYDWARAIERAHGIGEPPCEHPS